MKERSGEEFSKSTYKYNMMSKYNQECLNKLNEFFDKNFNKRMLRVYKSGPHEGITYVSGNGLNMREKQTLNDFCGLMWNSNFLTLQTAINKKIRRGTLSVLKEDDTEIQIPRQKEQRTGSTIVMLSQLVRNKEITTSEFNEVVSNLYIKK